MRDVRLSGSNTSKPALRWSTTSISSSFERWPRTLPTLLVLIIPALWLTNTLRSQSAETLPAKVADYRAYLKAVEYDGLSQYAYVVSELQPVWSTVPRSPLTGRAAILAARAYLETSQPSEAVAILRKYSADLA